MVTKSGLVKSLKEISAATSPTLFKFDKASNGGYLVWSL